MILYEVVAASKTYFIIVTQNNLTKFINYNTKKHKKAGMVLIGLADKESVITAFF